MMVNILVTKNCKDRFECGEQKDLIKSIGNAIQCDGGECGNYLNMILTIDRKDAPTAIELLKLSGFNTQYTQSNYR